MRIRLKYSAGPNFRLKLARGTATKISAMVPTNPPTKEPIADMPRAAPALPCRAILYPSKVVTTEAPSPGTLIRIDVVEPPNFDP